MGHLAIVSGYTCSDWKCEKPIMETVTQCWKIKNKNHLLFAAMKELAGDAQISFEGELHTLGLLSFQGALIEGTNTLKRCSLSDPPDFDFVILPLETENIKAIIAAIGGSIPRSIIHIQIAKADKLEFGAYDNFHSQCMFFGSSLTGPFLDSLVSDGILIPLDK
jgi:hypothetical protein